MFGITSTVIKGETENPKSAPGKIIVWGKTYGGKRIDTAQSIQQTSNKRYIFARKTLSFGSGKADTYIVKLDNKGNMLWERM